ncbi:hypothetical protein AB3S75_033749 [Citrus x aurantiifolia]
MGDLLGSPRVAPLFSRRQSRGRKDGGHGLSRFTVQILMGATIPALMHRIPSELRS